MFANAEPLFYLPELLVLHQKFRRCQLFDVGVNSVMVQARIEPELKSEVEKILRTLGLNTTDAISIYFRQIKLEKGIPFRVEIPNAVTRRAIEDSRRRRNIHKARDAAELFEKLGI